MVVCLPNEPCLHVSNFGRIIHCARTPFASTMCSVRFHSHTFSRRRAPNPLQHAPHFNLFQSFITRALSSYAAGRPTTRSARTLGVPSLTCVYSLILSNVLYYEILVSVMKHLYQPCGASARDATSKTGFTQHSIHRMHLCKH